MNESLIFSAAFLILASALVMLLMQNGRWSSPLISLGAWVAAFFGSTALTYSAAGDIARLALPAFLALAFSALGRFCSKRITAFGFGLVCSKLYVSFAMMLVLDQITRQWSEGRQVSALFWGGYYAFQSFLLIFAFLSLFTTLVKTPLGICLTAPKRERAHQIMTALRGKTAPRVSVHVPCYAEPPEVVIKTLDALARLRYSNYEVLVIDNNTKDPALWQPLEAHCRKLGERFRFFHVDPLSGAKAGAVNFALEHTDPAAEIISVVDADYIAQDDFLEKYVTLFADPHFGFLQTSHDYHGWENNRFLSAAYDVYVLSHKVMQPHNSELGAGYTVGTMCLVRRAALEAVGGWAQWCLTEDSELAVRLHALGYTGHIVADTAGRGLIPETFEGVKKQWFRWTAGPVQQGIEHWPLYLALRKSKLTLAQRAHEIRHSFERLPIVGELAVSLLIIPSLFVVLLGIVHAPIPAVSYSVAVLVVSSMIAGKIAQWVRFRYMDIYLPKPVGNLIGLRGFVTFVVNRMVITSLQWTFIIGFIAPLLRLDLKWHRTDKFSKSHDLLRAFDASRAETVVAVLHFVLAAILMSFARFIPFDYTALTSLWLLSRGLSFLSALFVSLISERELAVQEPPALLSGPATSPSQSGLGRTALSESVMP